MELLVAYASCLVGVEGMFGDLYKNVDERRVVDPKIRRLIFHPALDTPARPTTE